MSHRIIGILETLEDTVEVTGRGTGPVDGFQAILRMKASQFEPNHAYLVCCYGIVGGYNFFKPTTGTDFIVAELGQRSGGGAYLEPFHVCDPNFGRYAERRGPRNVAIVDGARGMPFFIAWQHTMTASPFDAFLVARIKHTKGKTLSPGATFKIYRPVIFALDLTNIDAEGTMARFYTFASAGVKLIPKSNQVPLTTVTVNGGASDGGAWFVISGGFVTNRSQVDVSRVWIDNGTSTLHLPKGLGFGSLGRPIKTHSKHFLAQCGVLDLPNNFTVRQRTQSMYALAAIPQSEYHTGYVFMFKMHADQLEWHTALTSLVDFWAQKYAGAFIERTQGVVSADIFLSATAAFDSPITSESIYIEIDGGELWKNRGFVLPQSGALTNLQHLETAPAILVQGASRIFRMLGNRNFYERTRVQKLRVIGAQMFAFGLTLGVVPVPLAPEVPGPELVIVPDRESTIALGSLPNLPIEPSLTLPIIGQSEIRELQIPRGYEIVSPKFLKGRRAFEFQWTGLSATETTTLRDFLDGLLDTGGGTFRWTPPGDTSDKPFTLEADEYQLTQQTDGSGAFQFSAIELVWFAT